MCIPSHDDCGRFCFQSLGKCLTNWRKSNSISDWGLIVYLLINHWSDKQPYLKSGISTLNIPFHILTVLSHRTIGHKRWISPLFFNLFQLTVKWKPLTELYLVLSAVAQLSVKCLKFCVYQDFYVIKFETSKPSNYFVFMLITDKLTAISARHAMTLPRVVSDRLMFAPSLRRAPVAPVASALSLPARSTRLILLTWKF